MDMDLFKVIHFLEKSAEGGDALPGEVVDQICDAVRASLIRQFEPRPAFRLRMSNIGRAYCQLHMEKNGVKPLPRTYSFQMNMLFGDMTEALLLGVMKAAGVEYTGEERVELSLDNGVVIKGSTDMSRDGVDDVKSASPWAFNNKFQEYDKLIQGDPFGYEVQLKGYAKAKGVKAGAWWVVNKATGEVTVLDVPDDPERDVQLWKDVNEKITKLNSDAPFERSFEDEEETFYRKPTGNRKLGTTCGFCEYRYTCWPDLKEMPNKASKAKNPPMVMYTHIEPDEVEAANDNEG